MNTIIENFLAGQGLAWEVEQQQMQLPSGKKTKFFANVRTDIDTELGVTKEGYEVLQNHELCEIALKVSDHTGFKLDSGNSWDNGERVAIRLKGKSKVLEYAQVGDVVENYLDLTNTFNGSRGVSASSFQKTLSCTNGMTRTLSERLASVRHSRNMRAILDLAFAEADLILKKQESMLESIEQMILAKMKPTDVQAAKAIEKMALITTGIDVNDEPEGGFSSRSQNIISDFLASVKTETEEKGFNVWGLLSGVTHYTTHKKGSPKTRERNKIFGEAANVDKKAFDYAEQLIEVFA